MLSILVFGLLFGMQHALEADHVAAVSSLVSSRGSSRRALRHGVMWGIGHALTLSFVAGTAVVTGAALSPSLAAWLEAIVGLMLIALGGHLLYRLARDKVHFHMHRHDARTVHLHAHSHAGDFTDRPHGFEHRHDHPQGLPWRGFFVGMVHGLAGSAALIILTASAIGDPWSGMAYVLVFGLGSVLGMAALSAVLALPLAWTARVMTVTNNLLRGGIGLVTCGIGVMIIAESLAVI